MLALIIFCILLTWLLCAAICVGIGFLLLKALRFKCSITDALWTGLALITAILQLYHFFRPIDLVAVFLLLGLGLAGWIWNYAVPFPDASAGNASRVNSSTTSRFSLSTLYFQTFFSSSSPRPSSPFAARLLAHTTTPVCTARKPSAGSSRTPWSPA